MRKIFLLSLLLSLFLPNLLAQYKYSMRAIGYVGKIVPHSKNLDSIATGNILGGEIAFEWQPTGEQHWQQFWNFPTVGLGLVGLNLGNNNLLGNAFAVYPYVLVPVVNTNYFRLNYKIGAGLALVTKTWNDADIFHDVDAATANSAISSHLNFYLNTGANLEFVLTDKFSLTADAGFSHISCGSIRNPNYGLNMLYGQVGVKYSFADYPSCSRLIYNPAYELPFDIEGKVAVSGGSREIHFNDRMSFFVGSIHAGLTFVLKNWYAVGGGLDFFYDGAFTNRPNYNELFTRYKIDENLFSNKIRGGIAINNEFIMGRITGLFDFGIYLYDPMRNAYAEPHKKYGYHRPMFYSYDIQKQDGWNYFRLGIRYRIWDNFMAQVSVKMHLQKAEMLEFGIGYLLPFARPKHSLLSKSWKDYYFYHHGQKEATAYPTPWK